MREASPTDSTEINFPMYLVNSVHNGKGQCLSARPIEITIGNLQRLCQAVTPRQGTAGQGMQAPDNGSAPYHVPTIGFGPGY